MVKFDKREYNKLLKKYRKQDAHVELRLQDPRLSLSRLDIDRQEAMEEGNVFEDKKERAKCMYTFHKFPQHCT
jgi:hypothetical protein